MQEPSLTEEQKESIRKQVSANIITYENDRKDLQERIQRLTELLENPLIPKTPQHTEELETVIERLKEELGD